MQSSPSRNPLLSRENVSSEEEDDDNDSQNDLEAMHEQNNYIATSHASVSSKESQKRRNTTPVDRQNFAYIVFYILGM